MGLNVQAVCDEIWRKLSSFLFFVQGTNDLVAYESSKIASLIEGLPVGGFAVGDNAYVNLNNLLVPFPGMAYLMLTQEMN